MATSVELFFLSTRGKECAMTGHIDEFDGVSLLAPIPTDESALASIENMEALRV